MENSSKAFATALVCVLAMVVMANASDAVKHRVLAGEGKGDGKFNETQKVASSPSPKSSPDGNHVPDDKGNTLLPQHDQSPPKPIHSDPAIPRSPPLANGSAKLVPPPGPENLSPNDSKKVEDNTPQSPPNKEDNKSPEAPKKEVNKPMQAPKMEDHSALQAPILVDKAPQAPKVDKAQGQNEGATNSGNTDENNSKNEVCETANTSNLVCRAGVLVACLLQPKIESTELFLIVQNTGEVDLNVNITSPGKIKIDSSSLNLPKESNKKIKLVADASMDMKFILNAGKGDCVLQTKTPSSDWLSLQQIPAYAAQVRPMHGAYFLFAAILIAGGTWAFCKFGKKEKRVDAGIPYQQLEMGTQTRSASVPAHVTAADGWDQSWDDDWDDEEAVVRSSAKQHAENASSNGLSSRSANPNQNGWEIDWDD